MLVKDCGHKHDFCCNIADVERAECTYVSDVNANISKNVAVVNAVGRAIRTARCTYISTGVLTVEREMTSQIAEVSSQISEERDRIKTEGDVLKDRPASYNKIGQLCRQLLPR